MLSWAHLSLSLRVLAFMVASVLYVMLGIMAWQARATGLAGGHVVASGEPDGADPAGAGERGWRTRQLLVAATLGLILSVVGNVLHLGIAPREPSFVPRVASWVLVGGYAVLMGVIARYFWHRTTRGTLHARALAAVAIAVFAVSAFHFVSSQRHVDSLGVELLVHYAPLPLVATLLYQEYRFALADVFLKRAVAMLLLGVLIAGVYTVVLAYDAAWLLLLGWIATALAYPALRDLVYVAVDRLMLRRLTPREVRSTLLTMTAAAQTPDAVLDRTSDVLREALTARWVRWSSDDASDPLVSDEKVTVARAAPSAHVHVPVADAPSYVIAIGPLAGGRRLLSEDFDMLESAALDIARRIDVMRMTAERYERSTREADALRLATEAELRALHAQLNPHFLFNALTTIGYLIKSAPDRAVETLLRLTDLLRGVLRRSTGELITVREELSLVEAYLAIERERFEERLRTQITVSPALDLWKIPPLVIQPLVENAIKHGITPLSAGGDVAVLVDTSDGVRHDGTHCALLRVQVKDTGAGVGAGELARRRRLGVGLDNVEQRIRRYYDGLASMTISSAPGMGTTVELLIPERVAL